MEKMKKLLIIGARGFGREVYTLSTQTNEYGKEWSIKGFLDDKVDALEGFENYPPIISSVEDYEVKDEDLFVCALGDTTQKKKYIGMILEKGGKFANVIHPTSIIGANTKIGSGVIICPFTYVSNDITMGNFVTVQTHSAVGHDTVIGDYAQINALTFFGGYSEIEDGATINPGAMIAPKKKVGQNTIIGLNSSVVRDIESNCTAYGNPAKKIFY
jgi:sugar O-acyltransferase (sialic acid O-acetyltransferase NeuD family)